MSISDETLADLAAQSRRKHGEKDPRPAVRRVFNQCDIPIDRSVGSRYREVLRLLSQRAASKRAKLYRDGILPSAKQIEASSRKKGPHFASHLFEELVDPAPRI